MGGILAVPLLIFIAIQIWNYEPMHKRIERMDNDPNNDIKSDKWRRAHPEWKPKQFVVNEDGKIERR